MSAYPYRTTVLNSVWQDYFAAWPALPKQSENAYAYLVDRAPCPVVTDTAELPADHPCHDYRSYRGTATAMFTHDRIRKTLRGEGYAPFIWMIKPLSGWERVYVLAHELGHALDYTQEHPMLSHMSRRRSARYRAELAAVSFAHAFSYHYGLERKPGMWKWIQSDAWYVAGYPNGWGDPSVAELVADPAIRPGQQLPLL